MSVMNEDIGQMKKIAKALLDINTALYYLRKDNSAFNAGMRVGFLHNHFIELLNALGIDAPYEFDFTAIKDKIVKEFGDE